MNQNNPTSDKSMTKPASGGRTAVVAVVALALVAALFVLVPVEWQLWIKALHVFVIIAWMAGMLYLPRLFVYHAEAGPGTPQSETFKVMERRLLKGIMTPSMILTWVLGLWLAWKVFEFQGGWIHAKIALVLVMSGLHGYLSASFKRFERDANTKSGKFWRLMNEVPAVILILIIILVVVKPF